uniref:Uncharacterized protein n=1 Tax=Glossina austeni TaxID=7395 RepID=A0A1A9VL52_GLOAU
MVSASNISSRNMLYKNINNTQANTNKSLQSASYYAIFKGSVEIPGHVDTPVPTPETENPKQGTTLGPHRSSVLWGEEVADVASLQCGCSVPASVWRVLLIFARRLLIPLLGCVAGFVCSCVPGYGRRACCILYNAIG